MNNSTIKRFDITIKLRGDNVYDLYFNDEWVASRGSYENILNEAKKRLGRLPDVTFGGFHLFQLKEGDEASNELIKRTAEALLPGHTVYYTGHCTGDYAFEALKTILGPRLCRLSGGQGGEL